eukprot:COSAG01_NODE_7732_length_3080_cov_148.901040_1_plen_239_part_00
MLTFQLLLVAAIVTELSVAAPADRAHRPPVTGPECGGRAESPAALIAELRHGGCGAVEYTSRMKKADFTTTQLNELATVLAGLSLRELELPGSTLGPTGVARLVPALAALVQRGCREINLSRVRMGDSGAAALVDALLPALQAVPPVFPGQTSRGQPGHKAPDVFGVDLDLSGNGIGDAGAAALAPLLRYVRELELDENLIGDRGARALREQLGHSSLQELGLKRNAISGENVGSMGD